MKENNTTKKNVKKNNTGKTSSATKKNTKSSANNKNTKTTSSKKTQNVKKVTNNNSKKQTSKKQQSKNNSKTTVKENKKNTKQVEVQATKEIKEEKVAKVETIKSSEKQQPEVKNANIKPQKTQALESSDFGGSEIRKLLIIIGAVCAVMLAFYFITEVVVKNKKEDKEETNPGVTESVIQYEEIIMGSLLNQNEEDYYVLAYDPEDPYLSIYNDFISSYKASEEPLKVYKVDLSKDFNKSYIADESYLAGTDVSAIKVKGTTLIRVSAKSVYKSFEGKDAIVARFKYMLNLD